MAEIKWTMRPHYEMCKHGHPRTAENVRYRQDGNVECRACDRIKSQKKRARQKAAKGES